MKRYAKSTSPWLLGVILVLLPAVTNSSDHADPINLEVLESGITDLFAFPDGDRMIVILNVRRALTDDPPYQLEPFEFAIYMDLHTEVTFNNAEEKARYGGSIPNPERIEADVTIRIRLKNDATLNGVKYEGLGTTSEIKLYTGVRDDPFIFPRFFKRNTIAMVLSIPFSSFPNKDQKDWIVWGTSTRLKDGVQIDHVGRSNRSQQGRFDFLNTLHPRQHVAAIKAHNATRSQIEEFLKQCFPPLVNAFQPLFKIRPYDYFPDVMIYTTRYPIGFPNGRKLTDDVALLTCDEGDCPLVEGAYTDSPKWPRATENDKPFTKEFPYLAEKWKREEMMLPPPAAPIGVSGALGSLRSIAAFVLEVLPKCCPPVARITFVAIVLVVLVIAVPVWFIARWRYRRAV